MNNIRTAARALAHPVTLVSIALLVLNDHVLKAAYPSFLTGKLSDAAGLFFFPYLLIIVIAWPLSRLGVSDRRAAAAGFWITFVWFSAVKMLPQAADLTAQAAAVFRGGLIRISDDSGDLVALGVLIPSWSIWKRAEARPDARLPRFVKPAAVALAIFGSLATSPCAPVPQITKLAQVDGMLYANFEGFSMENVVVSSDGGETWMVADSVSLEIETALAEPQQLPEVLCPDGEVGRCYRITGAHQVETSTDGGESWTVDWTLPDSRRDFMVRYGDRFLVCGKVPDFQVFDLALFESGGDRLILAAMGNEGILVKAPGTDWERRAVLDAEPTPLRVTQFGLLTNLILSELAIALVVAFLAYLVSTTLVLEHAISRGWMQTGVRASSIFMPMLWGPGAAILIFALFFSGRFPARIADGWYVILLLFAIGSFLLGIFLPWRRAAALSHDSFQIYLAGATVLGTIAVGYLATWLVIGLWVIGAIGRYVPALIILLVVEMGIFYFGLKRGRGLFDYSRLRSDSGEKRPEN